MDKKQVTAKDLQNETEIVAHLMGVIPEWSHLRDERGESDYSHHDRVVKEPGSGRVAFYIECKQRNETWKKLDGFGDIVLEASKFRAILGLAQQAGVPWHFAVRTADGQVRMYTYEPGDESRIPVLPFSRTKPRANGEWVSTDSGSDVYRIPTDRFVDYTGKKMAAPAKVPPITVLSGDDYLPRKREASRLIRLVQSKGWEVTHVDGSASGSLEAATARGSFFEGGEAKAFLVVENPEKVDLDYLKGFVANPPEDVALLLVCDGKLKETTKFAKFCGELKGAHRVFEPPKPWDAAPRASQFCIDEAKAHGVTLPPALAQALVQRVGTDLGMLSFEVLKFCTLAEVEGVKEATPTHIVQTMAPLTETPFTTVRDALQTRNRLAVAKALNQVKGSHGGDKTIPLARFLVSDLLSWLALTELQARRMSVEDIASRLGKKPFYIQKQLEPLRAWTPAALDTLVRGVAEAERTALNGSIQPWVVLTARLLESCG